MLSRKNFIAAASAGLAATSLVEWVRPAAAMLPRTKLSDIDHIIILMQENRSFDHYFGSLSGVRGFDDSTATILKNGRPAFYQPDPLNPAGFALPFRLNTQKTNAQRVGSLSHAWGAQHSSWNGGLNDNWLPAHRKADGAHGPLTMGYYTREDLPFYYALADAFTICDAYHCSVFGPTWPNRIVAMTGTNDPNGTYGGPLRSNAIKAGQLTLETYPERLERAGISWRIYHADDQEDSMNVCGSVFEKYHTAPKNSALYENALRTRSVDELLNDVRTGNIPQVTWIVPPGDVCEHPDGMPILGEDFVRRILYALWQNPKLWKKTAFILHYDENDGYFDHVVPPTPPLGTTDEFVEDVPTGLGFRVPCMVISPFSRGGYVCSQTFDHTSTLRLIEARFGVEAANISAWRREITGDLTATLGIGDIPRFDVPRLPDTELQLAEVAYCLPILPDPVIPTVETMPKQETGARKRRSAV